MKKDLEDLEEIRRNAKREFREQLAVRVGELELESIPEVVPMGNGGYYIPPAEDGCAEDPNVE
jgi:hypothetical protein